MEHQTQSYISEQTCPPAQQHGMEESDTLSQICSKTGGLCLFLGGDPCEWTVGFSGGFGDK